MLSEHQFQDLIRRVRAGEQAAAAELLRMYEPEVRRLIRLHMTHPSLRPVVDPSDIFQSVLANFFVRLSGGQFDIERPQQLVGLLAAMVRNKILDRAGQAHTRKRTEADPAVWDLVPESRESPSDQVARAELQREALRLMTEEERVIAGHRRDGLSWPEVAARTGGTPEAARKKLARAYDRVCAQLGLAEVGDGP